MQWSERKQWAWDYCYFYRPEKVSEPASPCVCRVKVSMDMKVHIPAGSQGEVGTRVKVPTVGRIEWIMCL